MGDAELLVRFKGDTSDIEKAFARVKNQLDQLSSSSGRVERSNKGLENSFGGLLKGYLTLQTALEAGRIFLDSTAQVQKFENQLKVASGTQQEYAKNTAFLEALSDKYNKNVIELGSNFAKLTIATRGTNLEGKEAERLFAAVTATSSALQMSMDETNGTFNAFIQMVSKGNVQAEELRGQLGERLYGAFNLAAKAMGVNTQELNKMLENGEVLAGELLPKLTIELEKAFGSDAQKNAHNLGSEISYVQGQLTLLVAEAGKSSGVTDFLTDSADDAGELVKELRNAVKEFGLLGALQYSAEKGAIGYVNLLVAGLEKVTNLLPFINIDLGRLKGPEDKLAAFNEYMKNQGMTPSMPDFPISGEIKSKKYFIGADGKSESPINTAAQERAKKAAEKAAKAAERELKKWTSEQIWEIKDEASRKIAEIEYNNERSQLKNNSWIPAQQFQNAPGVKNTYSLNGGEMQKTGISFEKELGSGGQKYKELTAGLQGMAEAYLKVEAAQRKAAASARETNNANAEMSLSIESVTNGIENMLLDQYGSMAAAAEKGWGDLIAKVKAGVMSYKEAINEFKKVNAGIQAGNMVEQAFQSYGAGLVKFTGEMGAALAGVGEDTGTVGDRLFSITASLLDQLGQALIVASGVFEAFEVGIMSMNPAVALVGAALAFGAASILRNQAHENATSSFWTGGVVDGKGGVDNVPAMLTAGEMVINGSQQSRLWGIISGAHTARDINGGLSSSSATEMDINVYGRIKGQDIDIAGKRGNRSNNYFRGK